MGVAGLARVEPSGKKALGVGVLALWRLEIRNGSIAKRIQVPSDLVCSFGWVRLLIISCLGFSWALGP